MHARADKLHASKILPTCTKMFSVVLFFASVFGSSCAIVTQKCLKLIYSCILST